MTDTKTVYGWVVDWGDMATPRISIDLFFSSVEKFHEVAQDYKDAQLVPIQVPIWYMNLDHIPDSYGW